MTYGSLFSGAGGVDIGFDAAGLSCAFQCEIDRTANEVLRHRWPDVPKHRDITKVKRKHLPKVDVLVGGFPCQDLSVAGNRGGLAGERSGLFYELARIASEIRPGVLVWENVPGLLSSDDGRDFARVLRHLADIGYFGVWRVLDAQYFGVPQQRRRVFGVFARGRFGIDRCAEILALAEGVRGDPPTRREARSDIAGTLTGSTDGAGYRIGADEAAAGHIVFGGGDTRGERRSDATLTTENQRNDFDSENFVVMQCHGSNVGPIGTLRRGNGSMTGGVPFMFQERGRKGGGRSLEIRNDSLANCLTAPNGGGRSQERNIYAEDTVRRLTPRECERLQGWPDDHTRYGDDGREIADGPRYRMVGNGVAAPVAEWIGRRIKEARR